ncbi:MAG: hypothetical protein ACF8NJ_05125 [Phycisphaerales bacterium JB038]
MKLFLTSALGLVAIAGTTLGATIDGVVDLGEYTNILAIQDTPTGFGDNLSELNAAFANLNFDGSLDLALTGNLEAGGNGLVIFIDSRPGGGVAEVLGDGYGLLGEFGGARVDDWGGDVNGDFAVDPPPGGPSILDPGFNPELAIEINTDGSTYWTNIIDMRVPNAPDQINRDIYLGSNGVGAGGVTQTYWRDGGSTNAGDILHAFDNSNVDGVWGYDWGDPPGGLGDPMSAVTGFEFHFSAEFLDWDGMGDIMLLPFITSGDGGWLSNQFLPGLGGVENPGPPGGIGGEPLFDAHYWDGDQFLAIPAPGTAALFGLAGLTALRRRR